jgi:hypothetical protein
VSSRTVRRILYKYGLRGCVAARKPLLSEKNRRQRYVWAKEYRHKSTEWWRHILFSDESTFQMVPSKHRWYIHRRSWEKFMPNCIQPTVKHGGKSVMMWGCISGFGIGALHECQGHVNSQQYLQILQGPMLDSANNLIPFPNQHFIFQEDNAPVHTARVVKVWLASQPFQRLPWPAQSPDMSPIECLWNKMKLALHNSRPTNKHTLLQLLREQWNKLKNIH